MVFMNWCFVIMSQVGDHHPDLYVWNLHNHHEVSVFFFPSQLPHVSINLPQPLKPQYLCVCAGSTNLCAAWWRDTAAEQVSRV